MHARRAIALINNRAGRFGSAARVPAMLRAFAERHGWTMVLKTVEREGDARRFADGAGLRHDALIVAGGDGTIAEAVSGMRASPVPLLILPTGSANLFARELGVPLDVSRALRLLADGALRTVDCGYLPAHDRVLLTAAIVGVGTRIFADALGAFKNALGYPAYVVAALRHVFRRDTSVFTITVDGRAQEEPGQMVVVANSNVGSLRPLHLGPSVRPDDGVLDVIVFRHRHVVDLLNIVAGMVRSPNRQHPRLTYLRGRDVRVLARPPLPIGFDGETSADTALHVTMLPGSLRVFVPH